MKVIAIALLWLWGLPLQAAQIDAAEYDLYSQLINTLYDGKYVVIAEDTDRLEEDFYDIVKEKAPTVADDFFRKNQKSHRLEKLFKVNSEYQLISHAQIEALERDGSDFWETFYHRYPKASGIFYLSRVGFNAERTKAFVVYHTQSQLFAGGGAAVIMKKENGRWIKETTLWVSMS